MRTLKLAFILPLGQFLVSLSILKWGFLHVPYFTDGLWFAINAPVLPLLEILLRLAPLHWLPAHIVGMLPRDFVLLAGAIIVWYFVGRFLDNMRLSDTQPRRSLTTGVVLLNLFLAAYGVRLFFVSLQYLVPAYPNQRHPAGDLLGGTIALIWSLGLIAFPCTRLVTWFRRKPLTLPLTNIVP
jgi:hypothetical protein